MASFPRATATMAEPVAIELRAPGGAGISVEWLAEDLERIDPASAAEGPWRLPGRVDPEELESVRMLGGRLGDGRVVAVAALRPAGASGHGDEVVRGLLGPAGELEPLAQVLVSTEYGPDGLPRRIGLELYESEGAVPLRVAGTATGAPGRRGDGAVIRVALELHHGGERGTAVYEQLTAR